MNKYTIKSSRDSNRQGAPTFIFKQRSFYEKSCGDASILSVIIPTILVCVVFHHPYLHLQFLIVFYINFVFSLHS